MGIDIDKIFMGIGILIALYLLVYYGKNTTALVGAGSGALTSETKALQGR